MFLVNGVKAKLRKYNRNKNDKIYDDEEYKDYIIKVCPYNVDNLILFGIYTVPNAVGYYQVSRHADIEIGDQLTLLGRYYDGVTHTVIKVCDSYIFNRKENKVIAVK